MRSRECKEFCRKNQNRSTELREPRYELRVPSWKIRCFLLGTRYWVVGTVLTPSLRDSVVDCNFRTEEPGEHFVRKQAASRGQEDSASGLRKQSVRQQF